MRDDTEIMTTPKTNTNPTPTEDTKGEWQTEDLTEAPATPAPHGGTTSQKYNYQVRAPTGSNLTETSSYGDPDRTAEPTSDGLATTT